MINDHWIEFLAWISEEQLIRFARRAELEGRPELAAAFKAELERRPAPEPVP